MWCYALGVVAVVLWSWCVVMCIVCNLVSNWPQPQHLGITPHAAVNNLYI